MTEPTRVNLLKQIDTVLPCGVGYRQLIAAIRYNTVLLLDDPEGPLPILEMINITANRHVRIWWGQSLLAKLLDLLF